MKGRERGWLDAKVMPSTTCATTSAFLMQVHLQQILLKRCSLLCALQVLLCRFAFSLLFSRCLLALIQSTDRTLLLLRCWCGCTQQHRTLNWTHILQSGRKSAHHTVSFPLFLFHSFIYSPFSSLSFLFFLSLLSWMLLVVVCSHIAIAVLHLASLCLCQDCFAFVINSSGRTLLAMCKMCIWVHPVVLHFVVHTSWLARSNNLSSHSHYSHKQTHTQCVLQISNLPKPNSTACVFMLLPRLQCQWISGLVCWASSSSSLGVFVVALFATLH